MLPQTLVCLRIVLGKTRDFLGELHRSVIKVLRLSHLTQGLAHPSKAYLLFNTYMLAHPYVLSTMLPSNAHATAHAIHV